MANEEHLARLNEGVEAWNAWREGNRGVVPDLSGADLSGAYLSSADLIGANLCGANLIGANLCGANLIETNLSGAEFNIANLCWANFCDANLSQAQLTDVNLSKAILSGANFRDANLSGANLRDADLRDADFKRANLWVTTLASLDLRQAKGLDEVNHHGASDVSNRTLFESKGKIPDVFLKGCGFPDWEIVSAKLHDPDLTSEQITDLAYKVVRIKAESPVQINPIFLSYSRQDSEFVDTIEKRFDEKRIRYWRDTRHATPGPLEDIVDRAMHHGRIVLLILSKDSVESDWVELEVTKARELAKESGDHVLCPIALDESWKTCHWERRLRIQVEKYHILDFSQWKNEDALAVAFQRLIDGLGIYYPKDVAGPTE